MQDYKNLKIWQRGIALVKKIYKFITVLPKEEEYGLKSQMRRCAVSIPANIAEGSSRKSKKDYKRCLGIALGSCFELETHLIIVKELEFADMNATDDLLLEMEEIKRMVYRFSETLGS